MTPPNEDVTETQRVSYLPPPSGVVIVSTAAIRWALASVCALFVTLFCVAGNWYTTTAKLDEISRRMGYYETNVEASARERQALAKENQMLAARVAVLEDRMHRERAQ